MADKKAPKDMTDEELDRALKGVPLEALEEALRRRKGGKLGEAARSPLANPNVPLDPRQIKPI